MLPLAEITAWSIDDIRAAIITSVPAGWRFLPEFVNGWFYAKFTDASGNILWQDDEADERLLFLNAYGWLHLRHHKPKHPVWKPRTGEVNLRGDLSRRGHVGSPAIQVPDPEDLDPEEVRAVYSGPRKD